MTEVFGAAGSELQVNEITAFEQNQPSIAYLGADSYLIVYQSWDSSNGYDIYGRYVDGSGNATGDEFAIYATDYHQQNVQVVATDGGYVLAFEEDDGETVGIKLRAYDTDDVQTASSNISSSDGYVLSGLVSDGAGGYVLGIASEGESEGGYNSSVLTVKWSNSDGSYSDDLPEVTGYVEDPVYAIAASGANLLVALTIDGAVTLNHYGLDGGSIEGGAVDIAVDDTSALVQGGAVVAFLSNGNALVAWTEYDSETGKTALMARIFDGDTAVTDAFEVATGDYDSVTAPAIAVLDDGTWAITYQAFDSGSAGVTEVYVKVYDNDGVVVQDETQVNTYEDEEQENPAIAAGDDGTFGISWDSDNQDNVDDAEGVYFQAFAPIDPYANLTATDLTLSSDALWPGDDITAEVTVANDGGVEAEDVIVQFYRSYNGAQNAWDTLLGEGDLRDLEAGATTTAALTFAYDDFYDTLSSGGAIYAIVDPDDTVEESEENDNMSDAASFDGYRLPYLSLSKTYVNTDVTRDAAYEYNFRVTNTGDLDADGLQVGVYWSAEDTWTGDGELLVLHDVGGVAASESTAFNEVDFEISHDVLVAFGSGYIYIVDDPFDTIAEHNEDSTITGQAVTVEPYKADLSIASLFLSVDEVTQLQDLEVAIQVQNAGDAAAYDVQTRLYWSADGALDDTDTLLDSRTEGKIEAGETEPAFAFDIDYDTLSALGTGTLIAVVDEDGEIDEYDDTDNTASGDVSVTTLDDPDLTLRSAFTTPNFTVGEVNDFSYQVQNLGDITAEDVEVALIWSATTDWTDGGEELLRFEFGDIAGGEDSETQAGTVAHSELVDLGDGYLTWVIDPDDTVAEADEDNNATVQLSSSVEEIASDLAYTSVAITGGTTLALGEDVQITLSGENSGTGFARARTKFYWSEDASFDDSDIWLDSAGHGAVTVGGVFTDDVATIDWDDLAEYGDGTLLAVLYDTAGGEHSVHDTTAIDYNFASGVTQVLTDFYVDDFDYNITGGELAVGQKLVLDLSVGNLGLVNARGETTFVWSDDLTLYDDDDVVLGADGHGRLMVGEVDSNEGMSIDYDEILDALADAGMDVSADMEGYVWAVMDYDDTVEEVSNGNNTWALQLDIDVAGAADLVIQSGAVDNTNLVKGTKINIDLTVANDGETEVKARTKFYWSSDQTLDDADLYLDLDGHGRLDGGESKSGQGEQVSYRDLKAYEGQFGYLIGAIEVVGDEAESDTDNNTWVSDLILVGDLIA